MHCESAGGGAETIMSALFEAGQLLNSGKSKGLAPMEPCRQKLRNFLPHEMETGVVAQNLGIDLNLGRRVV